MNVFISWSGDRSRAVAEALRDWLPKVIQALRPWLSVSDMEKGTRWSQEITGKLADSQVGIICLTPENLTAPWILFEAGALSKTLEQTRVCTFLTELDPTTVQWPLAMFQGTKAEKSDTKKLIETINRTLGESALSTQALHDAFEMWWTDLERKLSSIPKLAVPIQNSRSEKAVLEEILTLVRSLVRENESAHRNIRISPRVSQETTSAIDILAKWFVDSQSSTTTPFKTTPLDAPVVKLHGTLSGITANDDPPPDDAPPKEVE